MGESTDTKQPSKLQTQGRAYPMRAYPNLAQVPPGEFYIQNKDGFIPLGENIETADVMARLLNAVLQVKTISPNPKSDKFDY